MDESGRERDTEGTPESLLRVLDSAARLQELVPETVLVGGTVAAYYAHHRLSFDHDHVLADLQSRFDTVFDALDREGDFVLSRLVPGKIILGQLGDIEVGIRQLIRKRPLEVQQIELPSGARLTIPTEQEITRIKAFLIVKRNQVRDYLDVAALTARYGADEVAAWLLGIDEYYADDTADPADRPVLTQLVRQLGDPKPRDSRVLEQLHGYKGLAKRWTEWSEVEEVCKDLAKRLTTDP